MSIRERPAATGFERESCALIDRATSSSVFEDPLLSRHVSERGKPNRRGSVDCCDCTAHMFLVCSWRQANSRAQSKNALGQAYLLAGKPNVIRVDLDEREEQMGLNDVHRAKKELPSMARSHAEANGILVKQMFLETPADPYMLCPV